MIDNYDSFTYNLVHYLLQLDQDVEVFRNDEITINEIEKKNPGAIVISPGPGRPENAGISVETIKKFSGQIPILGVCLGHQAIVYAFGGKIIHSKKLMHGKTSQVTADGQSIFKGLENFKAMRYHSLSADEKSIPDELIINARSDDGEVMGVRHKEHCTYGIQFHPESIMTPTGKRLLRNFLKLK